MENFTARVSLSGEGMSRLRRFSLVPIFVLVATACVDESPPSAFAQSAGEVDEEQGEATEEAQVAAEDDAYADTDPSALTDFHSTLDPHGAWVDDQNYGTVWVPNAQEVGPDFAPYVSDGSWAYDDDYYWVSAYEWGWVPFHYGRWTWIEGRRWAWIPGREYAGAWVEWRVGPAGYGYLGWGPLPPRFGWHGGVAFFYGEALLRPAPVVFCPREEVFAPRVGGHLVVGERVAAFAGETRPYVRAEPVVAGHPAARGPAPAVLGIDAARIVRVNAGDPGVLRARAFARPSTAAPLGAHPASRHVVLRWRGGGGGRGVRRAPAQHFTAPPRGGGGHGGGRGGRH
jgi:hypothetical protein